MKLFNAHALAAVQTESIGLVVCDKIAWFPGGKHIEFEMIRHGHKTVGAMGRGGAENDQGGFWFCDILLVDVTGELTSESADGSGYLMDRVASRSLTVLDLKVRRATYLPSSRKKMTGITSKMKMEH